jgi:hypothetical protein
MSEMIYYFLNLCDDLRGGGRVVPRDIAKMSSSCAMAARL